MKRRIKPRNILLIFFLAGFFFSCAQTTGGTQRKEAASAPDRPVRFSNIRMNQKEFYPDKDETVALYFDISTESRVTLKLYDRRDRLVRTLINNQAVDKGPCRIQWDGKDDNGNLLPQGYYVFTLTGRTDDEKIKVYDPADETGGNLIQVRDAQLDALKGEIRYTMPKAGMVRIRAGLENSLLLRTLVDWEPRQAGLHKEPWDGLDQAGLINLFQLPEQKVSIFAYSLPDNSIILKRKSQKNDIASDTFTHQKELRPSRKIRMSHKFKHATHDAAICHEPDFRILFQGSPQQTADGIPVLSGIVPVKIVLSDDDKKHLESTRFEIMLFVDLIFLFEDEEGYTPFTYFWDTTLLPEGEHLLTVNIWSYDDHCGTKTRKVMIRR